MNKLRLCRGRILHQSMMISMISMVAMLLMTSKCAAQKDQSSLNHLLKVATVTDDPLVARDILTGIREGLGGKRMSAPAGWDHCFTVCTHVSHPARSEAIQLGLRFDDARAVQSCLDTIRDEQVGPAERVSMIRAGAERRIDGLDRELMGFLRDANLRKAAIRGLLNYNKAEVTEALLAGLAKWDEGERHEAIQVLAGRPESALALCKSIEDNASRRAWVPQFSVRQMRNLKSRELQALVAGLWGTSRRSDGNRRQQISRLKDSLVAEVLAEADLQNGRLLCVRTCLTCHELHGEGKHIGPNLTGAQRYDLYYLLSNIIDPSAEINRDFQLTIIETEDGRTLTGIVTSESGNGLAIQTLTDKITLGNADVAERRLSTQSMMPEGLLDELSQSDIRDLIGFLMADFRK